MAPPLKSAPQTTGTKGGLAMPLGDSLANVVTGMGGGTDRSTFNRWSFGNALGLGSGVDFFDLSQIEAAYRTSWLVRKVHDLIPDEMTKNWRQWSLEAEPADLIADEEKRLNARFVFREAGRMARLRGGSAVIMGLPGRASTPAPDPASLKKGDLRYLINMTRDRLVARDFIFDPDDENFGQPSFYQLSGPNTFVDIHPSRVIPFFGLPSTGLLITTGSLDYFWGHPLMESINEPLQDATLVQHAIAQLIPEAKSDIISIPGLTDIVSTQAGEMRLAKRLQVAQMFKSMFNATILDGGSGGDAKDGEEWETRQLTFTGLPDVGRFMLQVAAGACDIPLTRLIGAPPQGMNATGEHDEENFLRMIRSRQETDLRPRLERVDPYLLASAGVKVKDEDASWDFTALKTPTPEEQADLDNTVADTMVIVQQSGLVPDEVLSQVLITSLDRSPNFPGLKEAADASTEPLPATVKAEQAAEAAANASATAKAQAKAVGPVSLKPPRAGAGGAIRRVAKAAHDALDGVMVFDALSGDVELHEVSREILRDGAPRSLYISRQIGNPQEVLNHYRKQGVENLEAAGDLHVTIVHSREPVEWMKLPADWSSDQTGRIKLPPGGPRETEKFGPQHDVLVLTFAAEQLQWRNADLIAAGCSTDWSDYAPHVTLAKIGADVDVSGIAPYTGRILLGPEIWSEVRVKQV